MGESSYKTRVILEKASLDINRMKLKDYMKTDDFAKIPDTTKALLRRQAYSMITYSDVLGERIEEWEAT